MPIDHTISTLNVKKKKWNINDSTGLLKTKNKNKKNSESDENFWKKFDVVVIPERKEVAF